MPDASEPDGSLPRARFRAGLAGLVLLCGLLLLAGNATSSVLDRDEARFALAVQEMREQGDFIVPTNYGEPRYQKPILAYWLALASAKVFGPGEFAWRFPSAVCGVLTVLMTVALARELFGERVGLRAGAILATSLIFVFESKILTSDASLLASTTLSFWAWMRLRRGTPRTLLWRFLFWGGVGLGLLAKAVNWAFLLAAACALALLRSPGTRRSRICLFATLLLGGIAASIPGLGFLGPVALSGAVLAISWRSLRSPQGSRAWAALSPAPGAALALALAATWIVPALARSHGDFFFEGVGHHLFGRTATSFEGHRAPLGYYVLTIALTFFPWAALLPSALRNAWRDPRFEFLLAWILGPWVLTELMTSKLQHYLLVAFPALATLVAVEWERRSREASPPPPWLGRLEALLFAGPCLLFVVAGALLLPLQRGEVSSLAVALIALALSLSAALLGSHSRKAHAALFRLSLGGATALYLLVFGGLLPAIEPLRISPQIGAAVTRVARPAEPVHLLGFHPASVGCYLPPGLPIVADQRAVAHAIATGKPGLFVVPNGDDDRRFDRIQELEPGVWDHLETVRGLPFPKLDEKELWIVRRGPGEQ